MLAIYDSISQEKRPFHPLKDNHVRLYACGMTVYDYCHLGHARQMISFDVIVRYLRFRNYSVDFVRNITDIDDKIILRANENGETIQTLTERFIQAMYEDSDALGALRPDKEPKATEHIPHMIEMIEILIQKGFAYVGKNGDVYYKVEAFKTYGKLSHQSIDSLQSGVRIDLNEAKNNPLDFVLWKIAKSNEPSWDSPWGAGRPGWHIECSAMSTTVLGNHFDLHGGGLDLKFPHHENEIAQSEAATGETFVNTWMHTGLIQIDDEKMSKSLGNFTTVREALQTYHPEVIRYFMVASHYRSPLNYSETNLLAAKSALERLYNTLNSLPSVPVEEGEHPNYEERFIEKMDDDFNTPEALAILFELSREINRFKSEAPKKAAALGALLKRLSGTLGLLQNNPEAFLQSTISKGLDKATIEKLIAERNTARAEKNWAEADRIRKYLIEKNVAIEDKNSETTWRYN